MQKLTAFIIALIPAAVVISGGVFFYSAAPTTPMLILLLLCAFASVILGIVIYNRKEAQSEAKNSKVLEWNSLELEEDWLPIFPEEFVTRMSPQTGTLWLTDQPIHEQLRLESSDFNKLTNVTRLKFNHGYSLEMRKCSLIQVGDNQLAFQNFDELDFFKNSKLEFSIRNFGKHSSVEKEGIIHLYAVNDQPLLVFGWQD